MARVALVPCNSYDEEKVFAAVQTGVNLMGGISAFVKPDEKILLKPNLLSKALPQRAITTHPAVFSAVARLLREEGYTHISYGDSPGSPTATPQKAAESCGIGEAAQKYGIALADFESGSIVTFPKGYRAKSFYLCHGVQEADAFINLPKMKTHALERITGAVKNLYGCICGINKAAGHAQYPDSTVFAEMLADLHRYVKPRLHIMDGIVAMEGNGPTSGTPKAMNLLLFSDDPVALDTVFAALVNLDPATVPTNTAGAAAGIGTCNPDDIGILTPAGVMTVAQAAEHFLGGFAVVDGVTGQVQMAEVEGDLTALGDLLAVFNGLGEVGKHGAHFRFALDIELLGVHAHPAFVLQGLAGLDAQKHLLRL